MCEYTKCWRKFVLECHVENNNLLLQPALSNRFCSKLVSVTNTSTLRLKPTFLQGESTVNTNNNLSNLSSNPQRYNSGKFYTRLSPFRCKIVPFLDKQHSYDISLPTILFILSLVIFGFSSSTTFCPLSHKVFSMSQLSSQRFCTQLVFASLVHHSASIFGSIAQIS